MKKPKGILWFRQDLRIHDNEALWDAYHAVEEVLPVYVFDERLFLGNTKYGFRKTDIFRAKFIIEAITDLRSKLQSLGSDLIVRVGKPEEVLFEIARQQKTSYIFCNRERTQEEVEVQDSLEEALWTIGQEVRYSRGKMLFYTSDLPFPVTHTPDKFTTFRKEVEKIVSIREPLQSDTLILNNISEDLELGEIPELQTFNFRPEDEERISEAVFPGGESEALIRLNHYLWNTGSIAKYKETRDGMLGLSYSSKLSPYLAQGCISPKLVYHEVRKFEKEKVKNDSTYELIFELWWRDFFRLMGKKHGNNIFKAGGCKKVKRSDLSDNFDLAKIWAEGRTGIPLIDANMIELNRTGYMSNRGRRNVASYLINNLKVNWQIGAAYFESLLIDYDPCSNYGNWNYIAGVGTDPRETRCYNTIVQAKKYDAVGKYVRHWIPALKDIPDDKVHEPHLLSDSEQEDLNFVLGKHYPKPIKRNADLI